MKNKILLHCPTGPTQLYLENIFQESDFQISSCLSNYINIIDLDEKIVFYDTQYDCVTSTTVLKLLFPELSFTDYSSIMRDNNLNAFELFRIHSMKNNLNLIFRLPEDIDLIKTVLFKKKQLFEIKDLKLIFDGK